MRKGIVGVIAAVVFVAGGLSSCMFGDPLVKEGKKTYGYYCVHCHGEKGNGNGFNAVNLDPKPRDHTDGGEPYMAGRTNEELFEAVTQGGRGIGKSSFMPPFGGVLSDQERWALVAYMRTLHKNDKPKVVVPADAKKERTKHPTSRVKKIEIPVEMGEDGQPIDPEAVKAKLVQTGERLFEKKYGCNSCHAVNGVGGQVGPPLSRVGFRLRPEYVFNWIKNPQAIKPDTKMPNFQIRDQDVLAITLYLSTLKAPADGPPEGKKAGGA
ncbi:MAG: c-type cytochrome [Nitrospirota bacterium]